MSPSPSVLTCSLVVTGLVHLTLEELQTHDGVNGDHEEDQQGNMEEGQHGINDGVHHHLQTLRVMSSRSH